MTSTSSLPRQRSDWADDGFRLPDWLWEQMEALLPPRPKHPLGCHRPRVPDRSAMDAIFFVLRTGCQWNALNDTGICSSSSAHRRFQEWAEAGRAVQRCVLGMVRPDAQQALPEVREMATSRVPAAANV